MNDKYTLISIQGGGGGVFGCKRIHTDIFTIEVPRNGVEETKQRVCKFTFFTLFPHQFPCLASLGNYTMLLSSVLGTCDHQLNITEWTLPEASLMIADSASCIFDALDWMKWQQW